MSSKPKVNQKSRRKTPTRSVNRGRMYVSATFNNTLITITDDQGNTLCWGSTGRAGFKGSRKSTPFASTTAIKRTVHEAKDLGIREIEVYIKGPGPGRDAALRVLRESGLKVSMIADVTPIPHNGCRPKKRRRV
jgi:small subunit ribosomal protein S11